VGKTTLAAELLRRVMEREPIRVVAVATGELTVDGLFSTITSALRRRLLVEGVGGKPFQAVEMASRVDLPWADRLALLREEVLDRLPLLLVLDNFE
jgi:hypothetical protein